MSKTIEDYEKERKALRDEHKKIGKKLSKITKKIKSRKTLNIFSNIL